MSKIEKDLLNLSRAMIECDIKGDAREYWFGHYNRLSPKPYFPGMF